MTTRRIACILGAGLFLTVLLLFGGLRTTAFAQSADDLYQPGPDPIAPALPSGDLRPGDVLGRPEAPLPSPEATDKDKDGNGKDDLDMLDMDLKQLSQVAVKAPSMALEVSSVSKTQSTVGKSPAAVFVITSEMIRRSAANNIPDLLRLVPGLEVARIDAHSWAISSRGFNGRFANKLLVLVDGRTIYTPMYAGVYWDVQDVLLEDIERIEVIRGPGGTLWGANAVNGVINIITKRTQDTQGTYLSSGGGNEDLNLNEFRYGGQLRDDMYYRLYGRSSEHDSGWLAGGAHDDWRDGCAGFRVDWEPDRDKSNLITVQGDYYVAREGVQATIVTPNPPTYSSSIIEDEQPTGGNVVARWTHQFNDESDWVLQAYFDQFRRWTSVWTQNITTYDIDFQHRFPLELRRRHDLIWGTNFRQIHDRESMYSFNADFDPLERTMNLFGMFVQDQITLVDERLFFIAGSKFEQNSFTGFEYQPSGRVLYTPDEQHSLWAAVSRAVRTPDRYDDNGYLTGPAQPFFPPFNRFFPRYEGDSNVISEDMMAYEIGYRAQPTERFAYDIALFFNRYDNIIAFQFGEMSDWYMDQGQLIIPAFELNAARMDTWGIEVSTDYNMTERWRLSAAYTFLNMELALPNGMLISSYADPGFNPCNQARLMSHWDLGEKWQFDMIVRYVDSLAGPVLYSGPPWVDSYVTMDLRLAWIHSKHLEVSVIGRNLLDNHHQEMLDYGSPMYVNTEVERSVFGRMTWRY
ncbi:MAG TPA: TonB-dependent receptor [Thermoguttaceae bacterium]|nr:TonB-dependent receptor [Thermoguttaceae bacterium]